MDRKLLFSVLVLVASSILANAFDVPSPAPTLSSKKPIEPYIFELPPPSTNYLYAAMPSGVTVASGNTLSLTLTTNIKVRVHAVTTFGFEHFNACFPETLPSGINAPSASSYYLGMKSEAHFDSCMESLSFHTSENLVGNPFYFDPSALSQVAAFSFMTFNYLLRKSSNRELIWCGLADYYLGRSGNCQQLLLPLPSRHE